MRWQHDWMQALGHASAVPAGLRDARDAMRFGVYRASFEANLTQALRDTYPVTNRLLGEAYFAQGARAFLRAYPSRSGDIHAFGTEFAAFLAADAATGAHPYLPDVARLEWLAHLAFHAADAAALDIVGLAALPADAQGGLRLLPGAALMHSAFPVHRIWQVNQADWRGDATVSLAAGGVRLAVYREGLEIVVLPLDAKAYALACALREAGCLEAACEAAAAGASLGPPLHALIVAGLVAAP